MNAVVIICIALFLTFIYFTCRPKPKKKKKVKDILIVEVKPRGLPPENLWDGF